MKNIIKSILFVSVFLATIFDSVILKFFPLFKYIDEIITIIVFFIFIFKIIKNNYKIEMKKNDIKILVSLIFIVIFGLAGNFLYKIQSPFYVCIDIISCIKVYLVYVCLQDRVFEIKNLQEILEIIAKIYIITAFTFGILNLFLDLGMDYGMRYGIKAFKFVYNNPYSLIIPLVIFIAILNLNRKKNIIFIICALIIMILTLRAAGISTVGVYILISISEKINKNKKMNFISIVFIGVLIILLGYNQINTYFLQIESARKGLSEKAITIANDYFPTGAGFGTYASYSSRVSYSNLYYKYGLNLYHGLSENFPAFITDVYWPMILGQFSWIGLILFILIYYEIYKDIKESNANQLSLYFTFIFMVISTAGAQTMASLGGLMLIILLRYLMTYTKNNKELYEGEIRKKEK
mgnify:FL=1